MKDQLPQPKMKKKGMNPFLRGMSAASPIVLGYLPVGFTFGILAEKAGLTAFHALLMSLVVYAGSAQLIAVGLISTVHSPLTIILTTFIVNLRHLLFSAAISPYIGHWRKSELALFAYHMTDETFALHSTRFVQHKVEKQEVFAINLTAHFSWIMGSLLGVLAGRLVLEIEPLALDFVLPAMFIALLVMQIDRPTQVYSAVIAGTISILLLISGVNQMNVIIATLLGATCGAWMDGWKHKLS